MRSATTDPAKIQAARENQGLTQDQVAARLGVHRTAVSKWESKTSGKAPSPAHFKALCRVLRCKRDDLLADSETSARAA